MKSYLTNTIIIVSSIAFLSLAGSVRNSFSQDGLINNDSQINLYYVSNGKSNSLSLSMLTNSNEAVAIQGTTNYKAYGVHPDTLQTNVATNFSYDGEYQDPSSNLLYLRARYYNADIQRFIIQDSANVWNKYNFADSNPIMNIDPSGHSAAWFNYALNAAGVVLSIVAGAYAGGLSAPFFAAFLGGASGVTGIIGQATGNDSGWQKASLGLGIASVVLDGASGIASAVTRAGKKAGAVLEDASMVEGDATEVALLEIYDTQLVLFRASDEDSRRIHGLSRKIRDLFRDMNIDPIETHKLIVENNDYRLLVPFMRKAFLMTQEFEVERNFTGFISKAMSDPLSENVGHYILHSQLLFNRVSSFLVPSERQIYNLTEDILINLLNRLHNPSGFMAEERIYNFSYPRLRSLVLCRLD